MRALSLALLVFALTGCKTRPLHLRSTGAPPDMAVPGDLKHDLTVVEDLLEVDLVPPPPDLLPPPDLTLPFICRNVYVIDANGTLSGFDTETLQFFDIGNINCPTGGSGATPYSMAIARDESAYVLYSDGNVFRVNTQTAACSKTVFTANQSGFDTFGMGFSADTPGGNDETLFIASSTLLGSVAFPSMKVTPLASLAGNPELTGTSDAELWGFFPGATRSQVGLIDKATGDVSNVIALPSLTGSPQSWAFAFWGGRFWIFLQRQNDSSTVVYRLDKATEKTITAIANTGRQIVGAGVSSCAPLGLDMAAPDLQAQPEPQPDPGPQ